MKRSKSVVLTGMVVGASVSVTACDAPATGGAPISAQSYTSVEQCRQAAVASPADCERAYAQAKSADAQNAPRFQNRQACEEQYGASQCAPRNNGSFFTPLLAGFVVGQLLNGGPGYRGAPMYRDRGGNYFGGAGTPINRNYISGRTTVGASAFDANARAPARVQSRSSVISRGGFGGGGGGFGS